MNNENLSKKIGHLNDGYGALCWVFPNGATGPW